MELLGKLKEISNLRSVWPHEALDFTPWLAEDENLEMLSDAVGLDISLNETESSVGDFNVDIYATDIGTGRKIIIENQLGDTNHDHLGKLITYASGKSAEIIIWIVKKAREEHKAAVEWLNNHTDDDIQFFLIEIKLYQIENSEKAVKFEVVEKPNDWTKEIKKQDSTSPTLQKRYDYWTAFNEYAFRDKSFAKEFHRRKATTDHWMDFSIGYSECHLSVCQLRKASSISAELYISDNKELFRSLLSHRDEIEKDIGEHLIWQELPDRKASRIRILHNADPDNRDKWEEQFEWIKSILIRMKNSFRKYI